MQFTDTHTHIYDEQFKDDIDQVIQKAIAEDVTKMYMPNCDLETINAMHQLQDKYPDNCFSMMGLHPCYVKENYQDVLSAMEKFLPQRNYAAIGEIGLDYYWDKTFVSEQKNAFNTQIDWAINLNLPIVIHTRDAIEDAITLVNEKQNGNLRGIFHCFGGTLEQANKIIDLGFLLGIGGVVTFKNSNLSSVFLHIALDNIVLETDAPYLAPVPYRGKRNEPAYIPLVAQKLAEIYEKEVIEIANITQKNAANLFG